MKKDEILAGYSLDSAAASDIPRKKAIPTAKNQSASDEPNRYQTRRSKKRIQFVGNILIKVSNDDEPTVRTDLTGESKKNGAMQWTEKFIG